MKKICKYFQKKIFLNIGPLLASFWIFVSLFTIISPFDGVWPSYGQIFLNKVNIYSDLELVVQPLMILIQAFIIKVYPNSLIFEKIIFFLISIGYVHSLKLLVELTKKSYFEKLIIYLSLFFTGILFEAWRFDDYHSIANSFLLYSIYFSYKYLKTNNIKYISILGILSSLTLLTRLNQGFTVLIITFLMPLLVNKKYYTKAKHLLFLLIPFFIIFLLVMFIISENTNDWFLSTISSGLEIKTSSKNIINLNIFSSPLNLLRNSSDYIIKSISSALLQKKINWTALLVILFFINTLNLKTEKVYKFVLNSFLLLTLVNLYLANTTDPVLIIEIIPYSILGLSLITIYYASKIIFDLTKKKQFDKKLILILFPFLLFFFESFSSGGYFFGLYFPLMLSIYIFLLVFDSFYSYNKFFYIIFLLVILMTGFNYKLNNPFSWHSYRSLTFYEFYNTSDNEIGIKNYLSSTNDSLGYHLIDFQLYDLISPVCDLVDQSSDLLSIPHPFPNYYCNVNLWNNNVQSFFDTTSSKNMKILYENIKNNPPKYIFYQRDINNLIGHEKVFKIDPIFRDLDTLIMHNIQNKLWEVIYTSSSYPPSNWLLILTR